MDVVAQNSGLIDRLAIIKFGQLLLIKKLTTKVLSFFSKQSFTTDMNIYALATDNNSSGLLQ